MSVENKIAVPDLFCSSNIVSFINIYLAEHNLWVLLDQLLQKWGNLKVDTIVSALLYLFLSA